MVRLAIWALCFSVCLCNNTAFAARKDAFTGLIGERIEAFSNASSRGDQPRMNSLLDDEVLFSSGSGTIDREPKLDKSDAIATLLRQQTLNYRDADRRQDTSAMRRYLADDVLFINEDGIVSGPRDSRRDPSAAASKGISSALTVTDWVVHYSGDVAVASYVGEQTTGSKDQALNHKFLSVETWIKSDATWKLVASQSIPLYSDPSAVTLSSAALNDYVGAYTGSTSLSVVISLDGSALAVSTNGGKAVAYQAEGRDIFFMPGLPPGTPRSRIAFQRDKNGHITGYISSRGLELTRSSSVAPQNETANAQPGISSTVLSAAGLVVRHFGDVAIATFIHERVTHYYGQVLHTKYRSTETWIKRGTEWKMLALQSCELSPPLPRPLSLKA
jgi:ketosteroid isomerase-like protein